MILDLPALRKFCGMLLCCATLFTVAAPSLLAHGTVISPPSRVYNCYQENPENPSSAPCIAAVASHGTQPLYDWNEINQGFADGNHTAVVPDGNLASGGRPLKYGGMDQVRTDWVATPVSPGAFTVTWTNSAPHATAYYDVYITKASWTPDQPLTWNDLTLLVRTNPSPPETTVNIPVVLPARTGKHVIYSVWQRSDSPEAFYSTSDVDFGAALPVELRSFDLRSEGPGAVAVEWSTASEERADHFAVQHSTDGLTFQTVGTVAAYGTTSDVQQYRFTHTGVAPGKHFYRLEQRDTDGTAVYSPLKTIRLDAASPVRIYPTLTRSVLRIDLGERTRNAVSLQVISSTGHSVRTTIISPGSESFELATEDLPSGLYFLRIYVNNAMVVRRFVKE